MSIDWRIGDEARLKEKEPLLRVGDIVSLSGEPYEIAPGLWTVECVWGTGRYGEIDVVNLEPICAACAEPAETGDRSHLDWLCNTCLTLQAEREHEERIERERP